MPSWKVTNRASITNQPAWAVGGLVPNVGKGQFASNAIKINANGQGPFRFRTFCINQLGNIGGGLRNSMFGSSADGTNGCRDQQCVNPPYCARQGDETLNAKLSTTITPEVYTTPTQSPPYWGYISSLVVTGATDFQGIGTLSDPLFISSCRDMKLSFAFFQPDDNSNSTYIIEIIGCYTYKQFCNTTWKFKFTSLENNNNYTTSIAGGEVPQRQNSDINNNGGIAGGFYTAEQAFNTFSRQLGSNQSLYIFVIQDHNMNEIVSRGFVYIGGRILSSTPHPYKLDITVS